VRGGKPPDRGTTIALWVPGDWNAFFGLFTNVLLNVIVLTGLSLGVVQLQRWLAEGQFPEGSMAPKIRAIIGYLDRPERRGLITDPPNIGRALAGQAGTVLTFDHDVAR
jgi:hypothetical protein